MVAVGVGFTVILIVLPEDKLLLQFVELVIDVIVTVVVPAFVKLPAGTVKVPLPGPPAVKDMDAIRPVAELAPLKSYVTV